MKRIIKYSLILFLSTVSSLHLAAQGKNILKNSQLSDLAGFVENKGQIQNQNHLPNPAVKFLLSCPGFNIQLRQTGFSYDIYTDTYENRTTDFGEKFSEPDHFKRNFHRVDVELVNSNQNAQILSYDASTAYFNYLNSQKEITGVHSFQKIVYKNIYPLIDLEFYSTLSPVMENPSGAEYDFIVHPGGDINTIKLAYTGADDINLVNGKITIKVAGGLFSEKVPHSYLKENNQLVNVTYISCGKNIFSFSLAENIKSNSDLIIDPFPCMDWATYYGAVGEDRPNDITIDASGNSFITGWTNGLSGLASSGAYQVSVQGFYDAFVAKLNSTGTSLLWGTYYGGDQDDYAYGITVDAADNVYLTGYTYSDTLIATSGAFDTICAGADVFIAKFNPTGTSLLWGTYYGGTGEDKAYSLAIDSSDNIYLVGSTTTHSGMGTPGAYQTFYGGGNSDMFIAKFDSTGTNRLWGTYFGAPAEDVGYAIALDGNNNVYLTGRCSSGGLASAGSYQQIYGGGNFDALVAKFNSTGSNRIWGTYYGGTGQDEGFAISVDTTNNVYVTGRTSSTTTISTVGSWQQTYGGGNYDAFVSKFSPSGSVLSWGSYLGGNSVDYGYDIQSDYDGSVYVVGLTHGGTNLTTSNSFQPLFAGGTYDSFITKFYMAGASVAWSTFYGGNGTDYSYALTLNSANDLYLTGITSSNANISTPGSYQTSLIGIPSDAFVAKFSCSLAGLTEFPENLNSIQVFPNPSNGIFSIILANEKSNCEIEFYNILGEKIYSSVLSNGTTSIDLSPKAKGIYLYKVISENEPIGSGKVLIE
jgi:hypothetical protein